MNRKEKLLRILLDAALLVALLVGISGAAPVSLPYTFVNGQVADANQVNANFTTLLNAVNASGGPLVNIVVVHPSGTPAANGTALRNAVAGVTGAAGLGHILVQLEPGEYDLGTQSLTMKENVHLAGAGPGLTRIRGAAAGGTIVAASYSSLQHLLVENTAGLGISYLNVDASPGTLPFDALNDVTVVVSAAIDGIGIRIDSSNVFPLRNVRVFNDCPGNKTGIRAIAAGKFELIDVHLGALSQESQLGTAVAMQNTSGTLVRVTVGDQYRYGWTASASAGVSVAMRESSMNAAGAISGTGVLLEMSGTSFDDSSSAVDGFAISGTAHTLWARNSQIGSSGSHAALSIGGTGNTVGVVQSALRGGVTVSGAGNTFGMTQSAITTSPGSAATVSNAATASFKMSYLEGSVDFATGGTGTCLGTFASAGGSTPLNLSCQ